jgi:hypothetical protein
MELTIHERLKLLELLPQKESYEGVTEIYRTSLLLSLTGDEAEELDVKHVDGGIVWNQDKALTMNTDIPIGEWLTNIIRGVLREKSRERDLEPSEITLYEKFIMDYE